MTASIIALGSVVRITYQGLQRIRALENAPALVLQISHEVSHPAMYLRCFSSYLSRFLQVSEINTLLQVAEQAAIGSETQDNHLTSSLFRMFSRIKDVIQQLQDLIRHHLLKDPYSFDDETRKMDVRWHVWLRKESKIREMVSTLSDCRQKIGTAFVAMTAVSV